MTKPLRVRGFEIWPQKLGLAEQQAMVASLREVAEKAPLNRYMTPYGRQMSVRMTSAGRYGWVADRTGYRYDTKHPNGSPWPDIPSDIAALWHEVTGLSRAPDCCLVNYYDETARMGLHQDKDEADLSWPVLSISLGDDALFRMGQTTKGGKTESIWLKSGDVVVMGGAARLTYHGVDRIRFGSSQLLPQGGRINITLRVVD